MKFCCFFVAAFAVAASLSGCGPKELPYTDNSLDPLAYGRDVKILVATAARQAKGSTEPIDFLAPLLTELEKTDRPVGEFRAMYEDLRSRVKELVGDCEKSGGRAANLAGRLDELVKIAQALPGEVPSARN